PYLAVSRDDGRTWGAPVPVAPEGLTRAGNPSLVVGGVGKVGLGYAANFEDRQGVHAVLAVGYGAQEPNATFLTVVAES
ncbi:MAG: hypothetical protein HYT80_08690, partial [Euryarchaeota archaeon]|nr:hypothetical protein [Euryarchaeota archaeon]